MSGTLRICTATIRWNLVNRNGGNKKPSFFSIVSWSRSMVTVAKQTEEDGFVKTEPFPYKEKVYTKFHLHIPTLDPTQYRMNKNSKVVCVEGNIGSKKADVARGIAEAFGLYYMPEPRIDDLYVNNDGFDYRTLNKYIHPKLWAVDEKMYYENPHLPAVPWMKVFFYQIRYIQYIDALAHLFNTGQGVVLERSPHSDFVFADAMKKCGFLPEDAYDYYFRLRYDTIHDLSRPHLVIYLDTDVDVILKRIKERGISYQVNSKVLNKEYLETIENSYKRHYLEDANKFSELLVFKWNKPSENLDDIVSAIEKVNLDDWDVQGDKFRDWNFYFDYKLQHARYLYSREKLELVQNFMNTLHYDVESLECHNDDYAHRNHIYQAMVPNYALLPQAKTDSIGSFLKTLFTFPNKIKRDEFELRAPFY